MNSARFRERLHQRASHARVTLAEAPIDQIETYYALLNHWNKKINLTALALDAMSDHAIDRVLIEPLVAANSVRSSLIEWFDLGSGGGSPALPIRIVRPLSRLTLVEARSRKVAFLREAVRELSLANVVVIDDRIEKLADRPELAGVADLVTVRAVRNDATLFASSRRLLKRGGELFLFATKSVSGISTQRFAQSTAIELIPGGESELVILSACD